MAIGQSAEITSGSGVENVNGVGSAARTELEQLRTRANVLEAQLRAEGTAPEAIPHAAAEKAVSEHWEKVAPARAMPATSASPIGTAGKSAPAAEQLGAVTLELSPEEHDAQMEELLGILQHKGVTPAIEAADKSNSPHIIDDFHRILTEYVHEGFPADGTSAKPYGPALNMTLFEVTLPGSAEKDKPTNPTQAMREYITLMEQFYRGMLQMDTRIGEYFSLEIANPAGSMHTSLYVAVPNKRKALFEKQILSLYPNAQLVEKRDDYNSFADGAQTAAATAYLAERHIYSLRTMDAFSNDPLDTLLNSFSKLDTTGEGAAVQFVISPRDRGLLKRYRYALEQIRQGVPMKRATNIKTGVDEILQAIGNFAKEFASSSSKLAPEERPTTDDPRLKNIENKISTPIFHADIRIVASATTEQRAKEIVQDIEGTFQQFADTSGNKLAFSPVQPRNIKKFARAFSYRLLDDETAMPLSALELATMAHLPRPGSNIAAPELRQERAAVSAPPSDLPQTGVVLGINKFRGTAREVRITPEDRLRHLYIIGQTGTGKSYLMKNIIMQDILSGAGVCMIDPHGNDVTEILSAIPPERVADVIYFDPGSIERPMGLNMMEYDVSRPEQKTLVVDELLGIFKKLFGAVPESMGPAFEQYFRNAALLVMESPELGNTLLDIARVFSDDDFRARKLAACKNPIITRFWSDIATKATGEQGLENYAPYVTNKFDAFTTNEIIRPIIAQQKSAFNFRDLMDNRKILLVNLAKGRIGELNANLLGLVIVGKFLIAALSRADSVGEDLPPFYLHIDEFQNFTTPSIATIFSEARKYKLSLTVAHQFIAQLTEPIRDAVFGNVGSICAFRVGTTDAEFLEKQFAPTFKANDLMNIDNRNAYVKLLVNGRPAQPFNIETLPFAKGTVEDVGRMKQLSFTKYGRPRAEIEAEIASSLAGAVTSQEPATLAGNGL